MNGSILAAKQNKNSREEPNKVLKVRLVHKKCKFLYFMQSLSQLLLIAYIYGSKIMKVFIIFTFVYIYCHGFIASLEIALSLLIYLLTSEKTGDTAYITVFASR